MTFLLAAGLLAACASPGGGGAARPGRGVGDAVGRSPDSPPDPRAAARAWLTAYVDPDGRVVRRDQGGDTVSEGQAYALLLAVAIDDPDTVGRVWTWTTDHLMQPTGLPSWHWVDGEIADRSSAADADLEAVRALVLAGRRFDRPEWTAAGLRLGSAVLRHETVKVPQGRVLLAGDWAPGGGPPYAFNPSYVSPATTTMLSQVSQDPRWAALETGSRAAVASVVRSGGLPPDWATLAADGTAEPAESPGGDPVRFGYDAARTAVRYAESCDPADRRLAATWQPLLAGADTVAEYSLSGAPLTTDRGPLGLVAAGAAASAAGDPAGAWAGLAAAGQAQLDHPTYYGGAWAVLGSLLLQDPSLGGCPPLAEPPTSD